MRGWGCASLLREPESPHRWLCAQMHIRGSLFLVGRCLWHWTDGKRRRDCMCTFCAYTSGVWEVGWAPHDEMFMCIDSVSDCGRGWLGGAYVKNCLIRSVWTLYLEDPCMLKKPQLSMYIRLGVQGFTDVVCVFFFVGVVAMRGWGCASLLRDIVETEIRLFPTNHDFSRSRPPAGQHSRNGNSFICNKSRFFKVEAGCRAT